MSVEAPERIWVYKPERVNKPRKIVSELLPVSNSPEDFEGRTEYVRADKLEELAAEVAEWKERVQYLSKCIDEKSAEEDRLKAALAEAKRENEALQKKVMMLGVQLDDMMFLSVEGFLDWQREQREARNAGGNDA